MPIFSSTIESGSILTQFDWIIFYGILIVTIITVFWGNLNVRQPKSGKKQILDHLIMGRSLTLPMFVATLVATWYGGIFGVTQIAFNKGIFNFITQGFFWYLSYLIFAFFLVKKVSPFKAVTLPDLIGKMFGPRSAKLAAVFNFFNVLPIAYTISLGLFISLIFGISLNYSMLIGLSTVLLYSTWGGFRSVVISDILQFFTMCTGVFLVLALSISTFGGLDYLTSNLPETYFSIHGGGSVSATLVWGFIALSTLIDPNFYQRCFAARDEEVSRNGIVISTIIWFAFDICTTFGAMYAKAAIPDAAPDKGYFIYALQLLPSGLRGLFLAGVLATILSTLDSYLFLAGTTITYDLGPKSWRTQKLKHALGILFVGILSIIFAQFFSGNIKLVWKTLGSFSAGCLLVPVLWGHIKPGKLSDKAFFNICLFSLLTMGLNQVFENSVFWPQIDGLYIGILSSFLGLAFYHLKEPRASH